ncbi:murein hydrolase activator EnvC [Microbacterium sp. AG238]|uniref:murein hydrolase activator EnvC family protein n=1 Tax=Microbacterium sp. AG238 TaxID=2183994 RepID=UPI000E733724|nr:M23 family metallopeptidase [Microbacterium sp. AG238]RKE63202.1 peptidase M23-like protein [Microbacterium sp. AG238]
MSRSPSLVIVALFIVAARLFLPDVAESGAAPPTGSPWTMPLREATVIRPFEAPAHAYAPGHRGVDISGPGREVVSPAEGVIAFAGPVAGRAVITIDHGDGLVTSLEPVETSLIPGTPVVQGQPVGSAALGGHGGDGSIHFGVRRHGEYINPLLLISGLARPVLLPCC